MSPERTAALRAINAELAAELAAGRLDQWFAKIAPARPRKPLYADIVDPIVRRRKLDADRKRRAKGLAASGPK